ncbi:hypothetical protein QJS10_CPB13g01537 [Acorus calamus]|uniref:Uncharacterized protein n=1 Tax=Acorus calamus TaxID=4465 RepID=A0AAV9DID7_ACOCL|nr:hypothetical protein QJS10_CPB13g01537 [Acorus calamus]
MEWANSLCQGANSGPLPTPLKIVWCFRRPEIPVQCSKPFGMGVRKMIRLGGA